MNKGKSVCNVLKGVRKAIADANGIKYEPAECGFEAMRDVPGVRGRSALHRARAEAAEVDRKGCYRGRYSLGGCVVVGLRQRCYGSIWGRSRLRSRQKVQTKCSEWLRNSRAFPAASRP